MFNFEHAAVGKRNFLGQRQRPQNGPLQSTAIMFLSPTRIPSDTLVP
jgi:hypothetical protein